MDEIMDELREISERKGRSLDETIRKYATVFSDGYSLTTNITDTEETEYEYVAEDSGVYSIDYFGPYVLEEIEEETWEDIRKESAQTGEDPIAIAQRFIDALNDLASKSKIPKALLDLWQYTDNSEIHEKEYKKVV